MAKRGAAHIAGVDNSKKMMGLAREKTVKYVAPAGTYKIKLLQSDISRIGVLGRFDKILTVFSFIYAEKAAMLDAVFAVAACNLKPGGQSIIYTVHPNDRLENGLGEKYRSTVLRRRSIGGSDYISRVSFDGSGERSFDFCQWSRSAYELG